MTKQEFINRVLLIMNEAGMMEKDGMYIIGADNVNIDRHIEGAFVDAWRRCVKVMPRVWFGNKSFKSATLKPDLQGGVGYVVLPDDFYLLTKFKMKGWQKAVNDASIENEKIGNIQTNEWTRGSEIRPVCVLSMTMVDNNPKQVLNYYSLKKGLSNHTIEEAIYVPSVRPLMDMGLEDNVNLHDQVVEPLAYILASSVFTMFEKYDISKALETRAVEMFPGLQTARGGIATVRQ